MPARSTVIWPALDRPGAINDGRRCGARNPAPFGVRVFAGAEERAASGNSHHCRTMGRSLPYCRAARSTPCSGEPRQFARAQLPGKRAGLWNILVCCSYCAHVASRTHGSRNSLLVSGETLRVGLGPSSDLARAGGASGLAACDRRCGPKVDAASSAGVFMPRLDHVRDLGADMSCQG